MEEELKITKRSFMKLKGFEAYCTEIASNGSASDICSSYDELILRAVELEKDHEAFIGRSGDVEVSFEIADLREGIQKSNNNVVGIIHEAAPQYEKFVFVVGINDGSSITRDVVKINLHRPNEISTHGQVPTEMAFEAVAAVYSNTLYVAGLGDNADEIWKYNMASDWRKCASLVQGRCGHSAAFIDEVLYICGGLVNSSGMVLDSVEAFNVVTGEIHTVGKLVHQVKHSGNCVPFRSSLYIFGGQNRYYKDLNSVQVYNTKQNTCTLLKGSMPRPSFLMRAALWETSAILVGQNTCYIFDFEEESWQEREQFKTGVRHFGLVIDDERVFIIGGSDIEHGSSAYERRYDVRSVPLENILKDKVIEWKSHGILPKPSLVNAWGKMRMKV